MVVENKNSAHYNLALNEKGYLFLPEKDSRDVFLHTKGDNAKLGLRDRDFIMDEEIDRIQAKYPNLRILHYYAVENYVYHPDNIAELEPSGFDKLEYSKEITNQKNQKLLKIVSGIESARQTYSDLKEPNVKNKNIDPIISALESNDFEIFILILI